MSRNALPALEAFVRQDPAAMEACVRSNPASGAGAAERLQIILMLGRPRTCLVALVAYLLGLACTQTPFGARAVAGCLLCFGGTLLANVSNAYTDLAEDCRNLPGRVYLLARFEHRRLRWALVAWYLGMLGWAAALGWPCFLMMVPSLALVHQYSFEPLRAKRRPVLGLVVFAQVVAVSFLVSAFTEPDAGFFRELYRGISGWLSPSRSPLEMNLSRFLGMFAFLNLWFIAKGTFKNAPDYWGDRAAGLRTSATAFATWQRATRFVTAVTLGAYLTLSLLVVFRLEPSRLLFALVWMIPVATNCLRLMRASTPAEANACLKTDMIISVGFLCTVLLLVAPSWLNVVAIVASCAVFAASDLLRVDSRRSEDVGSGGAVGVRSA